MLHEKHDDPFHWKNKLDELDHIPNEPGRDKAASWVKLHQRLREKDVSRSTLWYWTAAACILISAGILLLVPKPGHIEMSVTDHPPSTERPISPANQADRRSPDNKFQAAKREMPSKPIRNRVTSKDNVTIRTPSEKSAHTITNIRSNIDDFATATIKTESAPMTTVQSPMLADTINTNAVTSTPAKRLRVVHINEIVKPVEEMPMAKATTHRSLAEQPGPRVFILSKNGSDDIIKIKLSPSN